MKRVIQWLKEDSNWVMVTVASLAFIIILPLVALDDYSEWHKVSEDCWSHHTRDNQWFLNIGEKETRLYCDPLNSPEIP